jgi:hypothetical protein
MQGKAQPLLVLLLPKQLFYNACSSIKGWRVWAGTAAFCAFLWAVMTGACGQQVLFGTNFAQPHMLCGAVLNRLLLGFAACIGTVKSFSQV